MDMSSPKSSFQAFMSQILDYAGMYPPASLPLEEAFKNFIAYQTISEAWMLSRFVIPAKRLAELPFRKNSHFCLTVAAGRI